MDLLLIHTLFQADESNLSANGSIGGSSDSSSPKRQLPCRCVPFGVDTEPNIRVIKPSALFYTAYQTHKVRNVAVYYIVR